MITRLSTSIFFSFLLSTISGIFLITVLYIFSFFFFFSSRRRHTRYIGDWSSDVCSSDLAQQARYLSHDRWREELGAACRGHRGRVSERRDPAAHGDRHRSHESPQRVGEIGRASCRERV